MQGEDAANEKEHNPASILVDGRRANQLETMRYRGLGMVSANNSSRLLLDYKAEHPETYWQILRLLFGKEGLEWKAWRRRTCSCGCCLQLYDGGRSAQRWFEFDGSAFLLLGENEQRCQLQVTIDGVQQRYETAAAGPREAALSCFGLGQDHHSVQIKVMSGEFCIDGIELVR